MDVSNRKLEILACHGMRGNQEWLYTQVRHTKLMCNNCYCTEYDCFLVIDIECFVINDQHELFDCYLIYNYRVHGGLIGSTIFNTSCQTHVHYINHSMHNS